MVRTSSPLTAPSRHTSSHTPGQIEQRSEHPLLAALRGRTGVFCIALYLLCIYPFCPELASTGQVLAVVHNAAPLLVLALGQTFVLLLGGIDLSVSGVIALVSIISASFITRQWAWAPAWTAEPSLSIAAGLLLGAVIGAVHGFAVSVLSLPAFLVTMSSMMILGGAAVWITHGERIGDLPIPLLDAAQRHYFGLDISVWIAISLALVALIVLRRTLWGQWLFAVGQNARAAYLAGCPVTWVLISGFAWCGACSALAALLYTARMETASPTFPGEILLDAIGAAVIGGTSLSGGAASALGVVGGTLAISLMAQSLTLLNLAHWHVLMAKGSVILLAAFFDARRRAASAAELRS
ncbi:MAG: ABC transporter permease [Planctomycetales bacterium]|nr:ABC transporter permease [Planctomycetales bacterium]